MALQKTIVQVPLATGLNTEVAPTVLQPGQGVLELENADQDKAGQIVKRRGGVSLTKTTQPGGGTLRQTFALARHMGALVSLATCGAEPLSVYSPTRQCWSGADTTLGAVKTDRRGPVIATPSNVAANGHSPDIAVGGGYIAMTWSDFSHAAGTQVVHQAIIDAATGHKVIDRTVSVALASMLLLKVVIVNGYAVFIYSSGANDITFVTFTLASLGSPAVPTIVTAGSGTSYLSDVRTTATTVQVLYLDAGSDAKVIEFIPSGLAASSWLPKDSAGAAIPHGGVWLQDFGGSGKLALVSYLGGGSVKVHWDFPSSGATRQAATTYVLDVAPGTVSNVTGHTTSASGTAEFVVLYDNVLSPPSLSVIKQVTRAGGVTGVPSVLYRSVALRTRTFTKAGDFYVVAEYAHQNNDGICTRYLLRVPFGTFPAPLAVMDREIGFYRGDLSSVPVDANGNHLFASTYVVQLDAIAGLPFAGDNLGVRYSTIRWGAHPNTTLGPPREALGELFVPGGALGQFDGSTYAEAGFAYQPEQGVLTPGAVGSMTSAVTYRYQYTYAYLDACGRLWRSGPTVPQAQLMGGADTSVSHAIPTLRIVGRTGVVVEVWRTAADQADTYQKVGQVANDPTADTVTFVDTFSDADLALGEFAPWTGGLVTSDVPPGFSAIAVYKNRLWGVSAEDPEVLWFTAEMQDGRGLLWSEVFTVNVRDEHGPITGVGVAGDLLIIVKRDAVYALGGDGPNMLNQGGFSQPQKIEAGVGSANAQSLLETADGLWFRSATERAGFHVATRGGSVIYAGQGVRAYNGLTVVGAALVANRQQLRFWTAEGRTMVFDLVTKVWSTYTQQDAVNGVVVGDNVFYVRPSTAASLPGNILQETLGEWVEGGMVYSMRVVSPWIIAGESLERIYRITGDGTTVGAHTLTCRLWRDKDDTNELGTAKTSAQTAPRWDWERRLGHKLSALKVELYETSVTAGPVIVGINLEIGVKGRLPKRGHAGRLT